MNYNRRKFLQDGVRAGVALSLAPWVVSACASPNAGSAKQAAPADTAAQAAAAKEMFFKISLAEWSLHRTLAAKKITNLDFPAVARKDFDISGIEYVNQFFKDKAKDQAYLADLKKRCEDNGVSSVLIMIDGEGNLGDTKAKERAKAVENHYQWVDAAQFLGCHSIRVNAYGEGKPEEVAQAAAESLRTLAEYAAQANMNIIVENHGSFSSDGDWMTGVMKAVNLPNCGMLPDFGNFCIERNKPAAGQSWWEAGCKTEYDRYKGVEQFMPFAKGVSAKSHEFDAEGNETETDFKRMMTIVRDAGYRGFVGIEYEGQSEDEYAGIRATKALLERVGAELS
jgi:sugar phosphate isomerase/epimerase